MEEANPIKITLVGGPMDGDTTLLTPFGSVGPPQQLRYFSSDGKNPVWWTYESELIGVARAAVWGEHLPLEVKYICVGKSLVFDEQKVS